jgi:hypothetical protein
MAISPPGGELRDEQGRLPGALSLVIVRRSGEVTCHVPGHAIEALAGAGLIHLPV